MMNKFGECVAVIPMNPQPPCEPTPDAENENVYASSGAREHEYDWSLPIPDGAIGIQEIGDQWCWLVKFKPKFFPEHWDFLEQ